MKTANTTPRPATVTKPPDCARRAFAAPVAWTAGDVAVAFPPPDVFAADAFAAVVAFVEFDPPVALAAPPVPVALAAPLDALVLDPDVV